MANLTKISLSTMILGTLFYWVSFILIDQPVANLFHHQSHQATSYLFFQSITLLGDPKVCLMFVIVSLLIAFCVLLKRPQNRFANTLLFLGLAMVLAIFIESFLKYLLGRYRPELFFQQGLYGFHFLSHKFLLNSSPSGHTTRFFVFVTGLSLIWRKITPLLILLGVLVAYSRLILEMHYVSDVFFGAITGTLVTLWTAKIYYSITVSHRNNYSSNFAK